MENRIPRPEYPNPQFERKDWINLNGRWEFEIDRAKSGRDRKLYLAERLNSEITVPFCPESRLSGIGDTDFLECVWYRRVVSLTSEQISGKRTFIHIGACDYETEVWVNGVSVGTHLGGYVHFSFDITRRVHEGDNVIVIRALDETRNERQPSGKQSDTYHSHGCLYTRTTGIWQTVWLEFTPTAYLQRFRAYPDINTPDVTLSLDTVGAGRLTVEAFYEGRPVGAVSKDCPGGCVNVTLPLSERHLWEAGHGRLYDLVITYGEDKVYSYFGLRQVALDGMKFRLNGRSVFQRTVLDQGFYPDGIYTAQDEEELERDIILSMNAGFNGARLHEKVFEPRFLYHCDRHGYLVWGEHANWGFNHSNAALYNYFMSEWCEIIERDFNHPAIIGWCPFNETWEYKRRAQQSNEMIQMIYETTKRLDPTRICIDTSGGIHTRTDIFDLHDYDQNAETLAARYDKLAESGEMDHPFRKYQKYRGEAVFMSEYGGIGLSLGDGAWSYGNAAHSSEELEARYKALTDKLLDNPALMGFCYTQLTNVEQEQNGIYTYDRKPKANIDFIREVNTRRAAIEDEE